MLETKILETLEMKILEILETSCQKLISKTKIFKNKIFET